MAAIHGAYTAMITPMNADGSVDYDGFAKNVQFQLDQGIDGLLPLGTTGETPTLTEDEEDKLIDIAIKLVKEFNSKTGKDVKVMIGAGSNCTLDAVRYVERAKAKGADFALVVAPYYNKPSKEGIYQHFAACSKVGIPIVVYNIAGRTGVNIPTDLMVRIADLPNIAGVKEASGSVAQMMEVIGQVKSVHPDFAVMSGDDGLTLPLVAAGGDGIISVASNLIPKLMHEFAQSGLDGDFKKMREIHYRLAPFFKAEFCDGNPTSIKYAMNFKKMPAGAMRLPLVEVTDAAKKTIEDAIAKCGL